MDLFGLFVVVNRSVVEVVDECDENLSSSEYLISSLVNRLWRKSKREYAPLKVT